ncbi:hypothetical protein TNCV_821951 [Trichonephila clavipes]|nr:hypothetical protein TNCV_821951 [Trichonephila clavipes]
MPESLSSVTYCSTRTAEAHCCCSPATCFKFKSSRLPSGNGGITGLLHYRARIVKMTFRISSGGFFFLLMQERFAGLIALFSLRRKKWPQALSA